MLDYILEISYPSGRGDLDDRIEAVAFLTTCTGTSIGERDGATVVSCYFKDPEGRDDALRMLDDLPELHRIEIDREPVDWLELYHQSLEAIEVGHRFLVAPDESLVRESSRLAIIIPQERAFGTGSHESTALCLEMLESLALDGVTGVDIGTGSGILAIGMLKLGARRVVAVDNDLDTFGIVSKNLARNRIAPERFLMFFGDPGAMRREVFEVATMNILAGVIVELLPHVQSLLRPSAALIVSGVVMDKRDEVVSEAGKLGLPLVAEKGRGEWWCGRFSKAAIEY